MTNNPTIGGVSREFVREGRYIVVKPDCEDSLRTERLRNYIEEMCFHTPDCVVVEADWPEYEPVWKMIEARVAGKPSELDAARATIEHLRNDLDGTRTHASDLRLKINNQKSTIARLEARITQLESEAEFAAATYQAARDRIAELESGRSEAPFYISVEDWNLLVRDDVEIASVRASRTRRSKFTEPLFTAPPAPVAVVLPERKSDYGREWDSHYVAEVEGWNACLDATAALNGPAK